jgi:hypothetical protein
LIEISREPGPHIQSGQRNERPAQPRNSPSGLLMSASARRIRAECEPSAVCCARVASGQPAPALPSTVRKSRRLMGRPSSSRGCKLPHGYAMRMPLCITAMSVVECPLGVTFGSRHLGSYVSFHIALQMLTAAWCHERTHAVQQTSCMVILSAPS